MIPQRNADDENGNPAQSDVANIITILFAAVFFCAAAIYNGYPLVYPDSGDYIRFQNPIHRTPFYSLALYPIHWKMSLWPVVIAQSLMIAHLLWLTARVEIGDPNRAWFIATATFLTGFSVLPWITGFLMPDILAPALLLLMYLLVLSRNRLTRVESSYCFALMFIAVLSHLSHLLISYGLCGFLLMIGLLNRNPRTIFRNTLTVALVPLAATVLIYANNAAFHGQLTLSAGGYGFLLGRLSASGQLALCLEEYCSRKSYKLCPYKNNLPANSDSFLWMSDSPFRKVGGFYGYRTEGTELVQKCILDHPGQFLLDGIKSGVLQLNQFETGYGISPLADNPYPTSVFSQHYPNEFNQYRNSRQNKGVKKLRAFRLAPIHRWVVLASVAIIVLIGSTFVLRGKPKEIRFYVYIAGAITLSALVTGGLSNPNPRYMDRQVWLVPYCAALIVIHFWRYKKN